MIVRRALLEGLGLGHGKPDQTDADYKGFCGVIGGTCSNTDFKTSHVSSRANHGQETHGMNQW